MARDLPDGGKLPTPRNWGDLRLRLLSAAIMAPIALLCIWVGGLPWAVLIAGATIGLAVEWLTLCGLALKAQWGYAVMGIMVCTLTGAWLAGPGVALLIIAMGALVARRHSRALCTGICYIGLPCLALIWLRADPVAGRANILLIIVVVWATDIGAYLAGRWFGGPKLAPRISPGKTWSGAAGGLVAAVLVGLATAPSAAMVAAGLSVMAQAGDLLESAAKRHFGVKDSGRLIPGHGGLLDRLDGVLAAALLGAVLAFIKGRGVLLWL